MEQAVRLMVCRIGPVTIWIEHFAARMCIQYCKEHFVVFEPLQAVQKMLTLSGNYF